MADEETKKDDVALAGGEEISVDAGGVKRRVFVRQLAIGELPALARAIAANGGFGDEAAMLALYLGPDEPAEGWPERAVDAIMEAGDRLNLDFLQRFMARSRRRQQVLAGMARQEKADTRSAS